MTDKELISIVDAKAKKLWNEINTGHEYSIIDSYNQFYGICMEIAEMVQEEPHCDERQFDELVKLQEGIGQIAKAVYEHKGKENSTVEKIREILIENSFDRMEIRGEILSDDLEKEICNYFNNWYFDEEMDIMVKPNHYSARFDDIKAVARHFAEWQKEKDQKK